MLFELFELSIINILMLIITKDFKNYLIITITIYILLALINPLYTVMYYLILSSISIIISIYFIITERYNNIEDKFIDLIFIIVMSLIPFFNNFILYIAYNIIKGDENDSKRI